MFVCRSSYEINNLFFLNQQLVTTIFVLLLLLLSPLAQSAETVLSDIRISSRGHDTVIDIDLGIDLIYSKHFPHSKGEILQVQMVLATEKYEDRVIHKEIRQGEDLKPPPGKEPILIYVTYEEGVPGGPYLTLRFARKVKFEVNAGDSNKGISIVIRAQDSDQTSPELNKKTTENEKQAKKPAINTKRKRETDVGQLMAKARQALTFGDNTGAITLLRRIIALPDNEHAQDARELLGLGLERDRQIPRAKFEYKKYLRLYKEGDGPKRVKQRLAALQSIGTQKRERLRVPRTRRRQQQDSFKVFGRLSQAYDKRIIQNIGIIVDPNDPERKENTGFETLSERFDTNLNIRARFRNSQRAIQLVGAGNYYYDIAAYRENKDLNEGETKEQTGDGRFYDLYVDYNEIKQGITATVGRQRARNTGLLSRFDGAMLGYQLGATLKPYVYFGSPVFFTQVPYTKKFYGAKIDYGKRKSSLGGTGYFTLQEVDGLSDRQGIGGTMRYSNKGISLFGMLDYDVLFNELTTANFRWGWRYSKKSKMNLTTNYRYFLQKSNATSSQPTDIGEIERCLGEDTALEIAKDKTSKSLNVTLGNSYQFSQDMNVSVDASYFQTIGLAASNGKTEGDSCSPLLVTYGSTPDNQLLFLSAQLVSSNTFAQNDLYVVGLRVSDSDNNSQYGVFLNGRLPPFKKLNIRPRLNLDYRDFKDRETNSSGEVTGGGTRVSVRPSARIDYRLMRQWVFESEFGYEWIIYSDRPNNNDENRALVRIGYHYTF